jgi:hypothetical protein
MRCSVSEFCAVATLTATVRPSLVSIASHTWPKPPAPSERMRWKREPGSVAVGPAPEPSASPATPVAALASACRRVAGSGPGSAASRPAAGAARFDGRPPDGSCPTRVGGIARLDPDRTGWDGGSWRLGGRGGSCGWGRGRTGRAGWRAGPGAAPAWRGGWPAAWSRRLESSTLRLGAPTISTTKTPRTLAGTKPSHKCATTVTLNEAVPARNSSIGSQNSRAGHLGPRRNATLAWTYTNSSASSGAPIDTTPASHVRTSLPERLPTAARTEVAPPR